MQLCLLPATATNWSGVWDGLTLVVPIIICGYYGVKYLVRLMDYPGAPTYRWSHGPARQCAKSILPQSLQVVCWIVVVFMIVVGPIVLHMKREAKLEKEKAAAERKEAFN